MLDSEQRVSGAGDRRAGSRAGATALGRAWAPALPARRSRRQWNRVRHYRPVPTRLLFLHLPELTFDHQEYQHRQWI